MRIDKDKPWRIDTTHASEALQAFAAYARRVEQLPGTNDVLVIRLHSDGSGCVQSCDGDVRYFDFHDLRELLEKATAL